MKLDLWILIQAVQLGQLGKNQSIQLKLKQKWAVAVDLTASPFLIK